MTVLSRTNQSSAVLVGRPPERLRAVARPVISATPLKERRQVLGQRLVEVGALSPGDLVKALALQQREDVRLGEILVTHGIVTETDLMQALADQWDTEIADLSGEGIDTRLVDRLGVRRCLKDGILPVKRIGSGVVVATCRPERFTAARPDLEAVFGPVVMALATQAEIHGELTSVRDARLVRRAEARPPIEMSCRAWRRGPSARYILSGLLFSAAAAMTWPVVVLSVLLGWAVLTMAAILGLKLVALGLAVHQARREGQMEFATARKNGPAIARLPVVSVMVPLLREGDVAGRLIERLQRLSYPRELTDILLLVEEDDDVTPDQLRRAHLPNWMRVITVPQGTLKTKPRALNYGLEFCRGAIVGIWDAEDAPDPDQLHKVVKRFHERPAEVVCLQGVLDYYNARTNWLSRCFTVEYAAWFRVVLPGLERLGLAIPLGGTTLFFRRPALEEIGGWDAHNVTEDADLGLRLARLGYRAEMVDTVTGEEANCRLVPWIRQRSRWIKGYGMTWAVHMRDPARLWRELGPRKFAGFQILFICTLSQFLLAPVLWSFWALPLGLPHPVAQVAPGWLIWTLVALFLTSELTGLLTGALAVNRKGLRHLLGWVPTLLVYYPLAAIASYKAFWEVMTRPFYWDKTAHGLFAEQEAPGEEQGRPDIRQDFTARLARTRRPGKAPQIS